MLVQISQLFLQLFNLSSYKMFTKSPIYILFVSPWSLELLELSFHKAVLTALDKFFLVYWRLFQGLRYWPVLTNLRPRMMSTHRPSNDTSSGIAYQKRFQKPGSLLLSLFSIQLQVKHVFCKLTKSYSVLSA